MPRRIKPFITGMIYHIFNRGLDRRLTFTNKREYQRALAALSFYSYTSSSFRLSWFIKLSPKKQKEKYDLLKSQKPRVTIMSYCLMPNHFHILVKQEKDHGISKFLGDFQNSYTKFFNKLHERSGALFSNQFKGVLVENENQFTHLSRYIHLNPYTSSIANSITELEKYPWSSLKGYLGSIDEIIDSKPILGLFGNSENYRKFIVDHAGYQKQLKKIEHLALE